MRAKYVARHTAEIGISVGMLRMFIRVSFPIDGKIIAKIIAHPIKINAKVSFC